MSNKTYKDDLSSLIERKISAENKVSYDIPYRYRVAAINAWNYSRKIGLELNTLISFEFEKDLKNSDVDIKRVRKTSHYCRVYVKNCDVDSVQIWTRHRSVDTNIEQVGILTHVPDDKFENFQQNVEGWKFETIKVTKVGSQKSTYVNREPSNIIEYLFRAVDTGTRVRIPNVVSELSGPIVGVRSFVSHKLRSYNR